MKPTDNTRIYLALVLIAAVAVCSYFMPRTARQRYAYEENRPWAYSLLTAPFDITVYRDSATVAHIADSIDASLVPIYRRDDAQPKRLMAEIEASDSLAAGVKRRLSAAVARVYAVGVVDQTTSSRIARGELPEVKYSENNVNVSRHTAQYLSQRDAYAYIDSLFAGSPDDHRAFQSVRLSERLLPNIVEDREATRLYRESLIQPVVAGIGLIQKGEKIIGPAEIVTPQLYQVLKTYESMLDRRSSVDRTQRINAFAGKAVYAALIFAMVFAFCLLYYPASLRRVKLVLIPVLLMVVFFIFTALVARLLRNGIYCVPLAILPVIITVFFDSRTAFFVFVAEVLLCAVEATLPLEFIFVETLAGTAVIFSLKDLSRRSELLRSAIVAFLAYVVSYVGFELMMSGTLSALSWRLIGYFGINAVLISFAYILVFIVEKTFGLVSVMTLVELSDINNRTLRELSRECPGTFQHSMAVSNLATEAAHRIGANVQLVRAGALYHDIGKIDNPAFFTENQYGVNPHDTLTPAQSARIITRHVSDGLRRAERIKLPKAVRDFIAQHHGRGKAKYFYTMECRQHPDSEVDPEPFTYPGPNPQTREASILMMADAVEAASRSLTDHSPEAIRSLVDRLIDGQVADGLHSDSPLSFRDIKEVKEVFTSRLRSMYHARVQYPKDTNDSEGDSQNDTSKM